MEIYLKGTRYPETWIYLGKWYLEIRGRCLFFRPNDSMSCNFNNETEGINGDLKHDELIGFKNCCLGELLEIIISRIIHSVI